MDGYVTMMIISHHHDLPSSVFELFPSHYEIHFKKKYSRSESECFGQKRKFFCFAYPDFFYSRVKSKRKEILILWVDGSMLDKSQMRRISTGELIFSFIMFNDGGTCGDKFGIFSVMDRTRGCP